MTWRTGRVGAHVSLPKGCIATHLNGEDEIAVMRQIGNCKTNVNSVMNPRDQGAMRRRPHGKIISVTSTSTTCGCVRMPMPKHLPCLFLHH